MSRSVSGAGVVLGVMMTAVLLLGARSAALLPRSEPTGPLPNPAVDQPVTTIRGQQVAVFSGGWFWGVEAVFEHVKGVTEVVSGFTGGGAAATSYDQVSTGTTGNAESVRVVYDSSQVTYGQLLKVFFSVAHDPTELNYQGPDHGPQYRSAIWYTSDAQKKIAEAYIAQLTRAKAFPKPIVTEVNPLAVFHPAEAYHQDYAMHHPHDPYIVYNDAPKVEHLRTELPDLYRDTPVASAAR